MTEKCRGKIGNVYDPKKDESVEGVQMTCPDGTEWSFPTGDEDKAIEEAKMVLSRKGLDANLQRK